jgi:hypothetical protein
VSEVYWVWGGEITGAAELSGLLQAQAAIRPAWVEELHWLAAAPAQFGDPGDGFPAGLPFFHWEMPGMQDHFLLQAAGRAVMLEQRSLVIIVEEKQARMTALALASPRAVGRFNLLPHARLVFLPSLQSSAAPEEIAARLLEPVQLSLDQVTWLADTGKKTSGGAVQLINKLVKKLDKNKDSYALLASLTTRGQAQGPAQGIALGTLIERI